MQDRYGPVKFLFLGVAYAAPIWAAVTFLTTFVGGEITQLSLGITTWLWDMSWLRRRLERRGLSTVLKPGLLQGHGTSLVQIQTGSGDRGGDKLRTCLWG